MSRTIDEGRLRFTFGDSWQVEKYDDHPDYRNKIEKLDDSKAVDIVGVLDKSTCFFIEIKDFRGYRVANVKRVSSGELPEQVALKVRDTIAGLIGAHRTSGSPDTWQPFVRALANRSRLLKVVLWLEDDRARHPRQWRAGANILGNEMKRKLKWLTTKVLVANQQAASLAIPDVDVSNIPSTSSP